MENRFISLSIEEGAGGIFEYSGRLDSERKGSR